MSQQENIKDQSGRARKVKIEKMGDKATKISLPQNLQFQKQQQQNIDQDFNILEQDFSQGYKPLTKQSQVLYEQLLKILIPKIPEMPQNQLQEFIDEIISMCKTNKESLDVLKNNLNKYIRISDEEFRKILNLCEQLEDFFAYKNNQQVNINFENKGKNIQDFNTKVEEIDQNQEKIQQDVQQEDIYDQNFLINLLQQQLNDEIEAKEMEQNILEILNLEDDNEVQNALMEKAENLDFEVIQKIYNERYNIYYGYVLNQQNISQEKVQEILQQIYANKILYQKCITMLQQFQGKQILHDQLEKLANDLDKEFNLVNYDNLTLEQFKQIPKKYIKPQIDQNQFYNFQQTQLKLPKDSIRQQFEGYEQITIPHNTKLHPQNNLIKISQLPEWCQQCFQDIQQLNLIQTQAFEACFLNQENLLLSAPTGAGKTVIALLCILGLYQQKLSEDSTINLRNFKTIYIAPMKALVTEIVNSFQKRLENLNVKVSEFTGDIHLSRKEFDESGVIVTTPEKWDVVSRKSQEKKHSEYIELIIIDEIHLLNDQRGPVIEAIVNRVIGNQDKQIRLVGLSATLPNYKEVAKFLKAPQKNIFYFDSTYRPIPLSQQYIGLQQKQGFKQVQKIKEIVYQKVSERIEKQQILIFVHSRKQTYQTAVDLKEQSFLEAEQEIFLQKNSNSEKIINEIVKSIDNHELKEVIQSGIGIHHAGLSRNDRSFVEDLFAQKHIGVLISTATLAWGVNLPAKTVIIKNTKVYSPQLGKWTELNIQDVLQMLGRAGRPLYDDEGEGIIITSQDMVKNYLSLVNEQLPIESQLLQKIGEFMNAEVVSNMIQNFKDAYRWISDSYFGIRVLKNPETYGIRILNQDKKLEEITQFKIDLVHSVAINLNESELIKYDKDNLTFESTEKGKIASYFYLSPNSIKTFDSLLDSVEDSIDVLKIFTLSDEFKYVSLRQEEKLEIDKLLETVPIPVKGTSDNPHCKINVLWQCYVGRLPIKGYSFGADMIFISQNAQRIFRALFQFSLSQKNANCLKFLEFCLMTERRVWNVLSPLRQFNILPNKIIRKMEQQEHLTWEHFLHMEKHQLKNLFQSDQLSNTVYQCIQKFPNLECSLSTYPLTNDLLQIQLNIETNFIWDYNLHQYRLPFWIFVIDSNQTNILYNRLIYIYPYTQEKTYLINLDLDINNNTHYFVKIVSDRFIKCEFLLNVNLMQIIQPQEFPLSTEFGEEKIDKKDFENFIQQYGQLLNMTKMNPIQEEVFYQIYETFENIFLGSIAGNGKFQICLSSIIRILQEDKNKVSKMVVIYPQQIYSKQKLEMLLKISKYFNIQFNELMGDLQSDIKKLQQSQLILSSVKNFDKISRNYKKRKSLKEIRIFIFEDIHYMSQNYQYEALISKMQLLKTLTQEQTRFILTSHSTANYNNVCDWLKIEENYRFNFSPQIRKNDMNFNFYNFDNVDKIDLFESMSKKFLKIYKEKNLNQKKCIVLIDTIKNSQLLLTKLLQMVINQKIDLISNEDIIDILNETSEEFDDIYQQQFIQQGTGYLHQNLTTIEIETILQLFDNDMLKVLIIPQQLLQYYQIIKSEVLLIFDVESLNFFEVNKALSCLNEEVEDEQTRDCLIFVQNYKKQEFKTFLTNSYPIESQLHENLTEIINQEIASGVINNQEDCQDWITWTFLYNRLPLNPNYYYLSSQENNQIILYLEELIEQVIKNLQKIEFIEIENKNFESTNLGIIAAFYDVNLETVVNFYKALQSQLGWREVLIVLSQQNDLKNLLKFEEDSMQIFDLYEHVEFKVEKVDEQIEEFYLFVILQSYLQRLNLNQDLQQSLKNFLSKTLELLQVFIDCCNAESLLKPCLIAMKLHQMLVQQTWINDSSLLQLCYTDQNFIQKANELNVNDIDDFFQLEEEQRQQLLLDLSQEQVEKMAQFANRIPSINIECEFENQNEYQEGEEFTFNIKIVREDFEEEKLSLVYSNGLIQNKVENWWIVVGDKSKNVNFFVRKIYLEINLQKTFTFVLTKPGNYNLTVMAICDSYINTDIEETGISINIKSDQFNLQRNSLNNNFK